MTRIRSSIHLHTVTHGKPTILQPDDPDARAFDEPDGLASDGRPCVALSASKGWPCPKPSAVVLMVEGDQNIGVCGGHYGVHPTGKPLTLTDR